MVLLSSHSLKVNDRKFAMPNLLRVSKTSDLGTEYLVHIPKKKNPAGCPEDIKRKISELKLVHPLGSCSCLNPL